MCRNRQLTSIGNRQQSYGIPIDYQPNPYAASPYRYVDCHSSLKALANVS
jgi:hypothetical protein